MQKLIRFLMEKRNFELSGIIFSQIRSLYVKTQLTCERDGCFMEQSFFRIPKFVITKTIFQLKAKLSGESKVIS
jgi:hypothetical protein